MAFIHSPSIVHDSSLVLCLDAANKKSYPGSGNTWTDLSNNRNHATMFGTVPYIMDIVNCFDFTGATSTDIPARSNTSSLGFTFNSNMVRTTGNFTFSCWIKQPYDGSIGQQSLFTNAGGADGYRYGITTTGIYYLISGQGSSGYTESSIGFINKISLDKWYNVVTIYNRDSLFVSTYLNGIYQGQRSIPSGQTAFSNTAPGIVRNPCCGLLTCKLANFNVYNKDLSSSEITQNFNALKGRFLL